MAETYKDAYGTDNAAQLRAYLAKNKMTGGKDAVSAFASLGLLDASQVNPKNRTQTLNDLFNRANTDQAFFNTFLSKAGGPIDLNSAFGPASGITAAMRAADPTLDKKYFDSFNAPSPVPVFTPVNPPPSAVQNFTAYTGPSIVDFLNLQGKDSSFANRAKLAAQAGIQNYTGTAEENTKLLGILNKPTAGPTASPSIGVGSLVKDIGNPAIPGNFPSGTADFMAGITAANATAAAADQARLEALKEEKATGTNKLMDAFKNLTGKAEEEARLAKNAGIPDLQNKLNDLNMEIAQKTAAYNQGLLDIEGKPIPMEFITGQQSQVKKQMALDIGALTSYAQVLQGNINAAKDTVDRTIKLEWEDRLIELDRAKTFLDLNAADMSKAEKKIADAQKEKIDAEKAAIQDFQELKKMAINAAFDNGASQQTIQSLFAAKDFSQLSQGSVSIPVVKPKASSDVSDYTKTEQKVIEAYINGGQSSKSVEADKQDIIKAVGLSGYNKILNAIKSQEAAIPGSPTSILGGGKIGPLAPASKPTFLQRVKNFFTGAPKATTTSESRGTIDFDSL